MKISNETVESWRATLTAILATKNKTCEDIKTGSEAWTVAHYSGVIKDVYTDREVLDAHIQTALGKIFPNAVFKDKKRY